MNKIIENYKKKKEFNSEIVEAVQFLFNEWLKFREKTGKTRWYANDFYGFCRKNLYNEDYESIKHALFQLWKDKVEVGEFIESYKS